MAFEANINVQAKLMGDSKKQKNFAKKVERVIKVGVQVVADEMGVDPETLDLNAICLVQDQRFDSPKPKKKSKPKPPDEVVVEAVEESDDDDASESDDSDDS